MNSKILCKQIGLPCIAALAMLTACSKQDEPAGHGEGDGHGHGNAHTETKDGVLMCAEHGVPKNVRVSAAGGVGRALSQTHSSIWMKPAHGRRHNASRRLGGCGAADGRMGGCLPMRCGNTAARVSVQQ